MRKSSLLLNLQNFNPRSYKRSDLRKTKAPAMLIISIHAPTRGATTHPYRNRSYCYNFNPRSYKRSDSHSSIPIPFIFISIHAPTRGATVCRFIFCNMTKKYFNPRSYKRSDRTDGTEKLWDFYFNPRSYKRSDSKNAQYSLCISAIIIA